jgi:phosphogluconate dehydratase
MSSLNPPTLDGRVARVTDRIVAKSRETRARYLDLMEREADKHGGREAMGCSNLAHGFAAALEDKEAIATSRAQPRHRHRL